METNPMRTIDHEIADHLADCLANEAVRQAVAFMIIDSGGDIRVFTEQFRLTTLAMWGVESKKSDESKPRLLSSI